MIGISIGYFLPKLRILGLALFLGSLAACGEKEIGVNVVGYNHTSRGIGHFTVNGRGGSFLAANEGGGKFACCVSIPEDWEPGLTAVVGWTDDHDRNYQERVVPVPRYERLGDFAVHFLANGEIKVFVTMNALWHPDYPLKGSDAQLKPGQDPIGPWGRDRVSN